MKILHIISSLETGGAQRLLSDILPIMARDNEVTLLVNRRVENEFTDKIERAGVRVVSSESSLYSLKNIFTIAEQSRHNDITHVHLFPTVYWAAFASLFSASKFVYTEHSTSNRRRGKWYLRPIEIFVYSRYAKIISISQQTQNSLIDWLGVKESKRLVVINNGVDLAAFQGLKKGKKYPRTLIMVSRFVASKDQETVIKAMKRLRDDIHIIFVGDGENLNACQEYAASCNLLDRVHFEGCQTDVASWLAMADIGIQSSNWEGFGLTAIEMMAAGLPVVGTEVNGLKQVIEGAGLLFPVGDEKELAGIINRLFSDEEYYTLVASRCFERSKLYDVSYTVAGYLSLYKQLL